MVAKANFPIAAIATAAKAGPIAMPPLAPAERLSSLFRGSALADDEDFAVTGLDVEAVWVLELTTEERDVGVDEDDVLPDANTSLLSPGWFVDVPSHEITIYLHM